MSICSDPVIRTLAQPREQFEYKNEAKVKQSKRRNQVIEASRTRNYNLPESSRRASEPKLEPPLPDDEYSQDSSRVEASLATPTAAELGKNSIER